MLGQKSSQFSFDFGLVLGPTVVTPDEIEPATTVCQLRAAGREETATPVSFSWDEAIVMAAHRTVLRPGDVVAGPPVAVLDGVSSGARFEVQGIGELDAPSG